MTVKLLVNLSALRAPLTGIGYYTKNILEVCLLRNIELVGIKNGRLYRRDEIQRLITSFDTYCIDECKTNSLKQKLVALLQGFPGVYTIKYFLVALRAKSALKLLAKQGFTYFEPNFVPIAYSGKTITTIHDLSFVAYPEFHPTKRVKYLTHMVRKSVSTSSHIITDSHFIKRELLEHYKIPETSVSTVHLGVKNSFRTYNPEQTKPTLDKLGLISNKYILSVATLEPRKNLTRLVEAYKALPDSLKNSYPLVLVGNAGWHNSSLFDSIRDLIDSQHVIVTGYLSDEQLNHMYAGATLFAYPSLYEGFGLPVIEAMASGCAVITSNCGATKEVAGDAAYLIDPNSTSSIKVALNCLLTNEALRDKLKESSIKRASLFTWGRCVDNILDIVNKTASN